MSMTSSAASLQSSSERMDLDAAMDAPLVAHVIVALCDNKYQGIVPVPAALGNGDHPATNLYWGAAYGVKAYFRNSKAWQMISLPKSNDPRILDRVMFKRVLKRNGKSVPAYVYAEAWQGRQIETAIEKFIAVSKGNIAEVVRADSGEIAVGNRAHVVAYVGHNGLMDFAAPNVSQAGKDSNDRVAISLACRSDSYFRDIVGKQTPLLLSTRSLMAPEAYSLEAAIERWFSGGDQRQSIDAAIAAYAKYQRISQKSARSVFAYPSGN
jgi:hypothetical protein